MKLSETHSSTLLLAVYVHRDPAGRGPPPLRQPIGDELLGLDSTPEGSVATLEPIKWIVPFPVHVKLVPAGWIHQHDPEEPPS